MKIKKGDNIIVLTGKDKGKSGKVVSVFADKNRVVVEGVNVVKKHKRSGQQSDKPGEIIDVTMPVDVSNVAILDPKSKKPTRIGYKFEDGKKIRIAKKSGEVIN